MTDTAAAKTNFGLTAAPERTSFVSAGAGTTTGPVFALGCRTAADDDDDAAAAAPVDWTNRQQIASEVHIH